jgi:hypothetical protein
MKLFKPPHVIVFVNMCPQHDKWTAGRVVQIDMEENLGRIIRLNGLQS